MKKMILFHGGSCCCLRQSTFGVLFGILINKNVLSRMYFFLSTHTGVFTHSCVGLQSL